MVGTLMYSSSFLTVLACLQKIKKFQLLGLDYILHLQNDTLNVLCIPATWNVLVDSMAALMKLIFFKPLLFCIRSAFFMGQQSLSASPLSLATPSALYQDS